MMMMMMMMMMTMRQKDFCTQQFLPAYQNMWRPQCVWWCQSHCCCSSVAQVLRRRKKKTHHPNPQICTRSGGIPGRRRRRRRKKSPKWQFHSLLFSTFASRLSDPIDSKDFGNSGSSSCFVLALLLHLLLPIFTSITSFFFFFSLILSSVFRPSSSVRHVFHVCLFVRLVRNNPSLFLFSLSEKTVFYFFCCLVRPIILSPFSSSSVVSKKSNAEKDSSRVPHLFLWRSLGSSSFLIFTSHLKQCTCSFFLSGVPPRGSLRLEIGFWDTCKGFIILFSLLLMMMAFGALRRRCGKQLPHLEQDIQRYFPQISLLLLFFFCSMQRQDPEFMSLIIPEGLPACCHSCSCLQ